MMAAATANYTTQIQQMKLITLLDRLGHIAHGGSQDERGRHTVQRRQPRSKGSRCRRKRNR